MKKLTELKSWKFLIENAFKIEETKFSYFSNSSQLNFFNNINIDFSNQKANAITFELLLDLAKERNTKSRIHDLIQGKPVNTTEKRPALHTALRSLDEHSIIVNGQNIMHDVLSAQHQMQDICEKIRTGLWCGSTGKPIKDIVNIGIGGSDLGPRFCIKALKEYTNPNFGYYFISDADPLSFSEVVKGLNQETTLFIISSKSFTTQETLYNAKKAFDWLDNKKSLANQIIAVTANVEKALSHGIKHVLPIWDWIGGRYSSCSAINLITAIAIGFDHFTQLLKGANQMDRHFCDTEFSSNLPVLLALFGIWNINFLHIHNLLLLIYAKSLEFFVPYLQQLDMESNGKSLDTEGNPVNYSTGPIIWGGLGNQAQHSYYQLLCQGTHKITVDFITLKTYENELIHSLFKSKKQVLKQGVSQYNDPFSYIVGNVPFNHIHLKSCTPDIIGGLIALYEHKIYVQSIIWGINPFDQPGVESAKRNNCKHLVN